MFVLALLYRSCIENSGHSLLVGIVPLIIMGIIINLGPQNSRFTILTWLVIMVR
jgi:hypothetical protein